MPSNDNANDEQYVLTLIQPDAAGRSFNVVDAPGCAGLAEGGERAAVVRFRRGVPQSVSKPVFDYLKDRTEQTVKGSVVPVFQVGVPDDEETADLPTGEQFEAVRERLSGQDERLDGIEGRLDQMLDLLQKDAAPKRAAPKKKRGRPKKKRVAAKAKAEERVAQESSVSTPESESAAAEETVTGAARSAT
jgi:hypothetical protein